MKDDRIMNTLKKTGRYVLAAMMICILGLSCKKEVMVADDLLTYVRKNLANYPQIPINVGGDTVITNLGVTLTSNIKTGFRPLLTEPAGSDVEISARIDLDPQLFKAYDSLYHTKSLSFVEGTFKLLKDGKVTVKAGQIQSIDSVIVQVDDYTKLPSDSNTYVIPISLEVSSGQGKLKSMLMYLRYTVELGTSELTLSGPDDDRNVALFNTDFGTGIPITANLTTAINVNSEVALVELSDKAFVDAYNAENCTAYKPFPAGSYKINKLNAVIPAYTFTSGVDVQFELTDMSKIDPYSDYIMAVKTKNKSNSDSNAEIVHIIKPKEKLDATNTLDRKDWVATGENFNPKSYPTSRLLDNVYRTIWVSNSALVPKELRLDMGRVQTVKGFSFLPIALPASHFTADLIETEVFSSNDNLAWTKICTYNGLPTSKRASTSSSDIDKLIRQDIKTIGFKEPVNARYFKFVVTKSSNNYRTGMAELYGLK